MNNTLKHKKTGSILVLSLWILAILILMCATLSVRASIYLNLSKQHKNKNVGSLLAQAGIYKTIYQLLNQEKFDPENIEINEDYPLASDLEDTQKQESPFWINNSKTFSSIKMPSGTYSIKYSSPTEDDPDHIIYGIQDEERWFNVNYLNEEFFEETEILDEELYEILLDWIDTDPNKRREGAENNYYQHLDIPYECKNNKLEFFEELLLLKNFDQEHLLILKEFSTVYGDGKVNFNTAPREILELLGLEDSLIDIIFYFRLGYDGIPGTPDDPWIENAQEIEKKLFEFEPLNSKEAADIQNLISKGLLDTKSKFFKIESHGFAHGSSEPFIIVCIVEIINESNFKIHSWKEK